MVSNAKSAPASNRPGKPTNEDKAKAWSDYQAEVRAVREKSAKLKELRLARDQEAEAERAQAKTAGTARKKGTRAKKSSAKA